MITQDMIKVAQAVIADAQAEVFFHKLAGLGFIPEDDQQAETLWQMADTVLKERPRLSDAGRRIKQASCNTFGDRASQPGEDGCSRDAHAIAEEFCRDQRIVKAAHLLLALQNAVQNN